MKMTRKRKRGAKSIYREFECEAHRQHEILRQIWHSYESISWLAEVCKELRKRGYRIENAQVAFDLLHLEKTGFIEFIGRNESEGRLVRLTVQGFAHLTSRQPKKEIKDAA
jgi:repressor of nif and glnA expression